MPSTGDAAEEGVGRLEAAEEFRIQNSEFGRNLRSSCLELYALDVILAPVF
jgi:hypothetical protein